MIDLPNNIGVASLQAPVVDFAIDAVHQCCVYLKKDGWVRERSLDNAKQQARRNKFELKLADSIEYQSLPIHNLELNASND